MLPGSAAALGTDDHLGGMHGPMQLPLEQLAMRDSGGHGSLGSGHGHGGFGNSGSGSGGGSGGHQRGGSGSMTLGSEFMGMGSMASISSMDTDELLM
jgi:hypothetical protein